MCFEPTMQMMLNSNSDGHWHLLLASTGNQRILTVDSAGSVQRRVLKRLLGKESCDKEILRISVGDPWNPHNSILGSVRGIFVSTHVDAVNGQQCDHENVPQTIDF